MIVWSLYEHFFKMFSILPCGLKHTQFSYMYPSSTILWQFLFHVVSNEILCYTYSEYSGIILEYCLTAETLRKYPPVVALTRECAQTAKLRDTDLVIEKGTQVVLPVYGLHHDPKYFPDPDRFDPERFSEEEVKKRPHFCYLPFGEGPRLCIGKSEF